MLSGQSDPKRPALYALPACRGAATNDKYSTSRVSPCRLKPPKEFFDALNRLGYVEGQNIAFEYRVSEEREERLVEHADDLVRRKVFVIVAPGAAAALAAVRVLAEQA